MRVLSVAGFVEQRQKRPASAKPIRVIDLQAGPTRTSRRDADDGTLPRAGLSRARIRSLGRAGSWTGVERDDQRVTRTNRCACRAWFPDDRQYRGYRDDVACAHASPRSRPGVATSVPRAKA